jgi:hypothetical protein
MTVLELPNRKLAFFQVTVANRDYHYVSQSEIAGAKRIYQHLSEAGTSQHVLRILFLWQRAYEAFWL